MNKEFTVITNSIEGTARTEADGLDVFEAIALIKRTKAAVRKIYRGEKLVWENLGSAIAPRRLKPRDLGYSADWLN